MLPGDQGEEGGGPCHLAHFREVLVKSLKILIAFNLISLILANLSPTVCMILCGYGTYQYFKYCLNLQWSITSAAN